MRSPATHGDYARTVGRGPSGAAGRRLRRWRREVERFEKSVSSLARAARCRPRGGIDRGAGSDETRRTSSDVAAQAADGENQHTCGSTDDPMPIVKMPARDGPGLPAKPSRDGADGRVRRAGDPGVDPRRRPVRSQGLRRTIRRSELRQIVPLADSTIYELERRGGSRSGSSSRHAASYGTWPSPGLAPEPSAGGEQWKDGPDAGLRPTGRGKCDLSLSWLAVPGTHCHARSGAAFRDGGPKPMSGGPCFHLPTAIAAASSKYWTRW